MSPEILSIFAIGIALAGLILNGQRRSDARFERLEKRLAALEVQQAALRTELFERMTALEIELRERMTAFEIELRERMTVLKTELRERMAKLEGLLEGLREALTTRQVD